MENNLGIKVFENEQFGAVRVVEQNGEPWFVAKDVCSVLNYTNPSKAILDHVDDEDKLNNESLSSLGQRGGWLVNESGLYSLILFSKMPKAKEFKRWVTNEVLPSIRKHGLYATPQTIESLLADPDTLIATLQELKKERIARAEAEKRVGEVQAVIEEQKPLVEHAQHMLKSPDNLRIRDFVQALCTEDINIGEKRLFSILRFRGILKDAEYHNDRKKNTPYQQYIDQGYFVVKEDYFLDSNGYEHFNFTTLVTPKGQMWIARNIQKWMAE